MIGIGVSPSLVSGPASAWSPLSIPGLGWWWDSTDIADGVDADAGPWVDRIAGAVATQVSPFKRNGSLWGSARTLRGITTGSSLAYAPAAGWTLPGAGVTVVHVFKGLGQTQDTEWLCLVSGNSPTSHRQWGLRGAAFDASSPGTDCWNKNTDGAATETKLKHGAGWGARYLTAFNATSGTTITAAAYSGGSLATTSNPAGYSGSYNGTDNGRICGSGLGVQNGLWGELRAVLAVNGPISNADLVRLAAYFEV